MLNLIVFASGNGSTLQYILDNIDNKNLDAKINLVVSNNKDAFALQRAKSHNVPTYVVENTGLEKTDIELENVLKNYKIDLIVLARLSKANRP